MPTKKTNSLAKRRQRKKKSGLQLSKEFIYLIWSIVWTIGLFKWGAVGKFIQLFLASIVGQLYLLALLALLAYSIKRVIFRNKSFFSPKIVFGLTCLILAALVFLQVSVASDTARVNIFQEAVGQVRSMWKLGRVISSIGGGLAGGALYKLSYFLFAKKGSILVALLLTATGLLTIANTDWSDVIALIHQLGQKINQKHRDKKESQSRSSQSNKRRDWMAYLKNLLQTSASHMKEDQIQASIRQEKETENTTSEFEKREEQRHSLDASRAIDKLKAEREAYEAARQQDEEEETKMMDKEASIQDIRQLKNPDYQLPPLDLLNPVEKTDQSGEFDVIEKNILRLEESFRSFGVDASVVNANLGPAVTKFEIKPAVGVKVNKIVHLENDLALALAAKDIRIEAPIPGKPYVGIEVPNASISTVSFREIVQDAMESSDLLTVPLGRGVSGQTICANLAKMPHLLIAGATGSGKSVCINAIITSLLMKTKPNEVKLMMVDPKKVELGVYNDIPHLLTPVVTNPRKAAQALNKVVSEMERRYELFAATGTRNIKGYNQAALSYEKESGEAQEVLPYIVVVVDELADLMMVASNEVETAITRLAQMARAAGIHMILATQRPSVDVITGIIKANVPSRIAFSVSSGIDSRTIIDTVGAEKLLGKGDMLFMPMGESKPSRIQGAYISDEEVERVVDFVKAQEEVSYVEEMNPDLSNDKQVEEPEDELFNEVVESLYGEESTSISMLQRKFRIGYNRAARLIDELENRGYISGQDGAKKRKVLLQDRENSMEKGQD
ncbi:DNA translocase FtsK [Atopobacter sp. AH10]|uniref:DNA translocase FtsK n=1 Tax=Atopobacter sp. AH10 TaxID=2315861 RepID=UPI000EF18A45|nr:DNA translocase FtsK [Atopobacter sp. AH10]RLK63238.1 DNA translocase FtsK [Atopobacter sp. AH10]